MARWRDVVDPAQGVDEAGDPGPPVGRVVDGAPGSSVMIMLIDPEAEPSAIDPEQPRRGHARPFEHLEQGRLPRRQVGLGPDPPVVRERAQHGPPASAVGPLDGDGPRVGRDPALEPARGHHLAAEDLSRPNDEPARWVAGAGGARRPSVIRARQCSGTRFGAMQDAVTVHIDAPPEAVWDLVSDVTKIGRYSPETFEAEWLDGATGPAVGARFRGHVKRNQKGPTYWATCVITECEPNRVLELHRRARRSTRASTTGATSCEPSGTGTDVTESFRLKDVLPLQRVLGAARLGPRQDEPRRDARHPGAHEGRARDGAALIGACRRVRRWRSRPSPGTAGRSPSRAGARSRCTCRRPAAGPCRVEVARVGGRARRSCSPTTPCPADDHPTPDGRRTATGCGWPAALVLDVDPAWRSGYYEVVLEIDVDGKRRRSHAFFVVRPPTGAPDRADPARPGHQHLARLQRLRRPQPLHRRHARVAAAPDVARLPAQAAGRSAAGSPPSAPPDPQMAAHVGYLQLNHLSPYAGSAGWPDWELPFLAVGRAGRATPSTSSPTPTSRTTPTSCSAAAATAVPVGRPRRVLVGPDARHRRGLHRPGRQRRLPLGQHVVLAGAPRGPDARGTGRDDGRLQGLLQAGPGVRHRPRRRAHQHLVATT